MLEGLTVKVYNGPSYPTQQVLELACAAQRVNKKYIKEEEAVYDDKGTYLFLKHTNRTSMLFTIDAKRVWNGGGVDAPQLLKITQEDIDLANSIKTHYKKLIFAAVAGDNDFQTTINSLLNGEQIGENMFGYVACLPSVYAKDVMHTAVKRKAKVSEEGYLADVGANLLDLDSEILEVSKSKNFEGYNICAIIGNKMVSWISKNELKTGPCVIVKAKVKDHSKHWKHGNDVTRLNYVKAAQ